MTTEDTRWPTAARWAIRLGPLALTPVALLFLFYGALSVDAYGFLLKDSAPEDLLAAVRRAAAGEPPFSPAVLRRVVDRAAPPRRGRGPAAAADPS